MLDWRSSQFISVKLRRAAPRGHEAREDFCRESAEERGQQQLRASRLLWSLEPLCSSAAILTWVGQKDSATFMTEVASWNSSFRKISISATGFQHGLISNTEKQHFSNAVITSTFPSTQISPLPLRALIPSLHACLLWTRLRKGTECLSAMLAEGLFITVSLSTSVPLLTILVLYIFTVWIFACIASVQLQISREARRSKI